MHIKQTISNPSSCHTQALLNCIYQGCQMGMVSLHRMAGETSCPRTRKVLLQLAQEHRRIMSQAADQLLPYRTAPRDLTPWAQLASDLCTRFIGGSSQPRRKLAGKLQAGARQGIRSLNACLQRCPHAAPSSRRLAAELMRLERQSLRESRQLFD